MKQFFHNVLTYIISALSIIEAKFFCLVSNKSSYGWVPDKPDHRDLKYSDHVGHLYTSISPLPTIVDMRSQCTEIWNQDTLGACTAHAVGAQFEFLQRKEKIAEFMPSRLFIYYNERVIEGTVCLDAGATIRDSIKAVATNGVCPESLWKYTISKFKVKPSSACYTAATKHKALKYLRVNRNLIEMKKCLADGFPFIFGFTVYENFESEEVAKTGMALMPSKSEKSLGGHAVMAVGYNDNKGAFLVRNSWGKDWGLGGYFYLPYDYFTNSNLSDDFWTIRLVN
ncbi:MAG: C1 family peptidase [Bacteroidales bacterium]